MKEYKVNMKHGGSRRCVPPCFIRQDLFGPDLPSCPLWLVLLDQFVQDLFCVFMQIGRRAIHYAGGFA